MRIADNPGLSLLTNEGFRFLLIPFAQIDTGAVVFPSGFGIVAQCLRKNNFASIDDALAFADGDLLDCSNLSGANDFDALSGFLKRPELANSIWDFSNANLNGSQLRSLSNAVQSLGPKVPRLILADNPVTSKVGNIDYFNLTSAFDVVDLGTTPFPNLKYVKASDPLTGANFGTSIALDASGDTMIVSAPKWSNSLFNKVGKVYIFKREPSGDWQQDTTFVPELVDQLNNALYGQQVSISADGNFATATRLTSDPDVRAFDIFSPLKHRHLDYRNNPDWNC